jgi:UDP-N-acetylglucosamine--N-acetylmuramyl-(pentapeptide) pyrophosphoryl-undecaprenol N-acetylglucosamine transferase
VRENIARCAPPAQRLSGRSGPLQVLVVGGSLGAAALNQVVPQAIALLPRGDRPQVIHQSGRAHRIQLEGNYRAAGVEATIVEFIDDMAAAYARADLVIGRAGAMTVSELAAAGVASLLVPYPHAVDDHQTANARFLADRGAALLMQQTELTADRLAGVLRGLTRERLMEMAQRARELSKSDAAARVADVCEEVAAT